MFCYKSGKSKMTTSYYKNDKSNIDKFNKNEDKIYKFLRRQR